MLFRLRTETTCNNNSPKILRRYEDSAYEFYTGWLLRFVLRRLPGNVGDKGRNGKHAMSRLQKRAACRALRNLRYQGLCPRQGVCVL